MTKDEALDLALEALDNLLYWDNGKSDYDQAREAIAAIKQARALDKMAENARELGLDYEPVTTLFGSLPVYDTPPVQEPVAWIEHHKGGDNLEWENPGGKCTPLYTTPPAAQRQWVGLTDEEKATAIFGADKKCLDYKGYADAIEAKLKELNT